MSRAARSMALSLAGFASFACSARGTPPSAPEAPACRGDCYFVDARSGSDSNDGRSPSAPFATLDRAARAVQPGSTVLVMSGTYTSDGSAPPLTISASGTADAWITFRAAPGEHPTIRIPRGPGAWAGIRLVGSAYVVVDGFEVIGQNASITPAEGAQSDGTQAVLNQVCVLVDGAGPGPVPHDIVIRHMTVHDCSGAGIAVVVADAVAILKNRVYDNAWWSVSSMSGISLYHLTDVPGSGTFERGYKNLVAGNVVYGNENRVPWPFGQPVGIYDGNGIIFDDGDHGQPALGAADVQGTPYTGRSWVVNNIVHDNGGRGIHVYHSSHVDVVNNTAWNNLLSSSPFIQAAEIDAIGCTDARIVNNVAVNLSGKETNATDGGTYAYNAWSGASVPNRGGVADVVADPMLADPAGGDFSPLPGSPARGSGSAELAPEVDFFGNPRSGKAVDRGAIQASHRSSAPGGGTAKAR